MAKIKTYCFDIDGVICSINNLNYNKCKPDKEIIALINQLYSKGNTILIYTARFMGRTNNDVKKSYSYGYLFTIGQLKKWGVKFHILYMGKPRYDVLIDDKALFFKNDIKEIIKEIK